MLSMDRWTRLANRGWTTMPSPTDLPNFPSKARGLARTRPWAAALLAALLLALVPAVARAQGEPPDEAGAEYADTDPSALNDFREPLNPYGHWVTDPTYGTVWVPNAVVVGKDFAPYQTAGHWAATDTGEWAWVSDYDWGYIPFHYGRWVWIQSQGWSWIPGRRYAPAWVVWRTGEPGWDYVGWAPMGPSYLWMDGIAVGYWGAAVLPFWFVSSYWLFDPHWHHHMISDRHQMEQIAGHTHLHGGSDGTHRHAADATSHSAGGAEPRSGHTGASPSGRSSAPAGDFAKPMPASISAKPSSPSYDEARIPERSRPKELYKGDPRATALAKPTPERMAASKARGYGPSGKPGSAMRPHDTGSQHMRPGSEFGRPQPGSSSWRDSGHGAYRPGRPEQSGMGRRPWQASPSSPSHGWRPPSSSGHMPPSQSHASPSFRPSSPSGSSYHAPASSPSSSSRKASPSRGSSSGKSSGSRSSHRR